MAITGLFIRFIYDEEQGYLSGLFMTKNRVIYPVYLWRRTGLFIRFIFQVWKVVEPYIQNYENTPAIDMQYIMPESPTGYSRPSSPARSRMSSPEPLHPVEPKPSPKKRKVEE